MIDLGELNGGQSIAYAVSSSGYIVGHSSIGWIEARAVLWRPRH